MPTAARRRIIAEAFACGSTVVDRGRSVQGVVLICFAPPPANIARIDAEISYPGPDQTISGGGLRLPDSDHVRDGGRGIPGAARGVRAADGRAAQGRSAP